MLPIPQVFRPVQNKTKTLHTMNGEGNSDDFAVGDTMLKLCDLHEKIAGLKAEKIWSKATRKDG